MIGSNEKRIIKAIKEHKNSFKTNHSSRGEYFDFVFLCGKARSEDDNRSIIEKRITTQLNIGAIYAEDFFGFIANFDLLTFEELLLELSTTVIIIVESFGAACELGAFSFVDKSLHKLLVINNKDYETEKSFINEGPIQKIKNRKTDRQQVFYEKFVMTAGEHKLIISNELSNAIDNLERKRTFRKEPYKVDTVKKELIINDVLFLLWLIVDLLKMFGSLRVGSIYHLLLGIFEVKDITIKLSTSNKISGDDVQSTIDFIVFVLTKFEIIKESNGHYVLNYSYLEERNVQPNKFSSLLFTTRFMESRDSIMMRAKILNKQKKQAVKIWT